MENKLDEILDKLAAIDKKRCLVVLKEYFLKELLKVPEPLQVLYIMKIMRDSLFNAQGTIDFNEGLLTVQKNGINFNIVLDESHSIVLFAQMLKIKIDGNESSYQKEREHNTLTVEYVKEFTEKLQEVIEKLS